MCSISYLISAHGVIDNACLCESVSTHTRVIRKLLRAGCNTSALWQIWNRVSIIVCHLDPVLLICPTKVLIEITGKTAPVKYSIAGLPSITECRDWGGKMVLVRGLIILWQELTLTCLMGWEALICNVLHMITFNKVKEGPQTFDTF